MNNLPTIISYTTAEWLGVEAAFPGFLFNHANFLWSLLVTLGPKVVSSRNFGNRWCRTLWARYPSVPTVNIVKALITYNN